MSHGALTTRPQSNYLSATLLYASSSWAPDQWMGSVKRENTWTSGDNAPNTRARHQFPFQLVYYRMNDSRWQKAFHSDKTGIGEPIGLKYLDLAWATSR